ncbi:peroxiredoxin-like 2A [Leptonychotes weddellii]|uniref:DPY30 domain-containing protein 2 n=1 Tax=Leptonychotes weddellii TaxID=9713 RepID=A0A2U3XUE0_LEPWE|nr:peroxiredoxin-like 2A [Leptonychotes weddellii]
METDYLKRCFGNCLSQALAEVAKVRPSDPVEYLAHWLYHYRKITKAKEEESQEMIQLKEEHDNSLKETKMTEMPKQEECQIQQQYAKCHKIFPPAPHVPCLLQEAADLSSLKPKLDELGVPLYAVVKEQIRTEVQDFQPYFKGEIFLDEKKKFYGPQRRKMMFMGFVRLGVWYNFFRARNGGFSGNLEGEGFILGGVFVVGSGKQGILLEHREKEFGDKVNPVSVLEAVRKIQPQTLAAEAK